MIPAPLASWLHNLLIIVVPGQFCETTLVTFAKSEVALVGSPLFLAYEIIIDQSKESFVNPWSASTSASLMEIVLNAFWLSAITQSSRPSFLFLSRHWLLYYRSPKALYA